MKRAYVVSAALAALLAATSFASAQYRDNPPGSAFQQRGIDENIYGENPYAPNRRGYSYRRQQNQQNRQYQQYQQYYGQYYGSPAYGWQGSYAYDPRYRY
jgi:hypothetical protein